MSNNTIKDLNNKKWYRALKVVYIFLYGVGILFAIVAGIVGMTNELFFGVIGMILTGIGVIILFTVIKHAVYYILLGKWLPPKE